MATAPAPESRAEQAESALEDVEIQLLLEGIHRRYGFDFRGYAAASLRRRLRRRMRAEGLATISGLQELVLHDPGALQRLLGDLSIAVTSMFRDPSFYRAFRERVCPILATYPFTRIWNAGCATGEETYSLAILLQEEDLYDRCRIYATDLNEAVLEKARSGVFRLERMQEYTENYIRAGGKRAFSEYYTAAYDGARFVNSLSENVVFAQHNLVSDGGFNEFHVIVCRNVLIYFDRELQDRVHALFHDSLIRRGVLAIGQKESIRFTAYRDRYEVLDADEKLYRKLR
jgi:chemotaxis protein methyltransferase CheR